MSQGTGGKLRLMVVDDEPDNLDLLYRTFRRDFEVFRATSGMNALDILEQSGEMAIIISDQRMPGMNGTEFLSKTVDRFPDTIRIVLTGYTDVEDLVDAINTGKVFKYITKPWMPDHLKAVVQQAAETYKVLKKRTNELNRALRRESLLNAVMTAIRESLDYNNILTTIADTTGRIFEADYCILKPVDGDRLMSSSFTHQTSENPIIDSLPSLEEDAAVQKVLELKQTQTVLNTSIEPHYFQLVIPLVSQQEILAVLSLYQFGDRLIWPEEDIQLIQDLAEQAALAIAQAKLYQKIQDQTQQMRAELEVARQIQGNLLRQSWPEIEGVRIQAYCYPAREVGGDFFEVFVHPQGDIWLTVGDVSGKGVPAALFMASTISVLRRELSQESPPDPDIVMQNLNESLSPDLISNNRFITMVLACYNPKTHKLSYANAGHVYPLVWSYQVLEHQLHQSGNPREPEPQYLKVRSIPLGIRPIWKSATDSITLQSGEIFLLTSDGITEATIPESSNGHSSTANSMLKQTGLWQLLLTEPIPLELTNLLSRVQAYSKIQEDDQTILALEVL